MCVPSNQKHDDSTYLAYWCFTSGHLLFFNPIKIHSATELLKVACFVKRVLCTVRKYEGFGADPGFLLGGGAQSFIFTFLQNTS